MSKWTRLESVPVPTVWVTFEGKIVRNGTKKAYWIQDITDEYTDQVLKYMVEEFVFDEPFCKYSKIADDPEVLNAFKEFWMESFKQNLGLVCLTKDEKGIIDIAGMNCTLLGSMYDNEIAKEKLNSNRSQHVFQTLQYVKNQVNAFEKFNIVEYLDGMGLYVLPKYRGEGLGLALLQAREPLCKAVGLKASLTLFTSKISQKLAERAGFRDLFAIDYDELEKKLPLITFPGIQEHTKSIRFMYILYE